MLDERLDRFGELLERHERSAAHDHDQQQAPAATITTPTDREIHVERVFDAPRDRVFAAYTDPELDPRVVGPARDDDRRRPDGRRAPAAAGAS